MKDQKYKDFELLKNKSSLVEILNQCLKEKLKFYTKYIGLTKEIMTKPISNEDDSISVINSYIEVIQKDYDILKEKYDKYKSLLDFYFDEISFGKPILEQNINEAFCLNYYKDKSESIIRGLKDSIKLSKEFAIFREPKRDSLVDTTIGNREITKTTDDFQQSMLYECKCYKKIKNKIKKNNNLISEMKKNIAILKKYLEDEKSKNKKGDKSETISNEPTNENEENIIESKNTFKIEKKNFKILTKRSFLNLELDEGSDEKRAHNNSAEDNRGYISNRKKENASKFRNIKKKKTIKKSKQINIINKKRKNKTIENFQKVEDLFNISMEEGENEKIIDEELHSDDEYNFEIKIKQQKQISKYSLNEIKKIIPTINLKQIEYNKIRLIKEVDRYSIQRRKYKRYNLKELKSKIEQMNYKANLLEKKMKVMEEYIKKNNENYQQLKHIKDSLTAYRKRLSFSRTPLNIPIIDSIKEEENDCQDFYDSEIIEKEKEKEKKEEENDNQDSFDSEITKKEKEKEKKEDEKDILIKNNNNSNDFKISVVFRKAKKNNIYGKELKKMMEDKFSKNKIKEKSKNKGRAKSK